MKNINQVEVEQVFQKVVSECIRSGTKQDLHPNNDKDLCLAVLLEQVRTRYGQNITDLFQLQYEHSQPALSFLFAQVTNAVLEKTFHQGSCHAQAAYSLFELYKVSVFNTTLVWSRTGDPSTEHYYLIVPDEYGFNRLKETSDFLVRIGRKENKPIFGDETIFFDSWSKELRRWKQFTQKQWEQFLSQSKYAMGMSQTDQGLFRPLILQFESDQVILLEKIIWCLSEYKKRLQELPPKKLAKLAEFPQLAPRLQQEAFQHPDTAFDKEVALLTNTERCLEKLLAHIREYEAEFRQQLEKEYIKLSNMQSVHSLAEAKEQKLVLSTKLFFSNSQKGAWKKYPEKRLTGSYVGHQVRFFNMPGAPKQEADNFKAYLENQGFDVKTSNIKSGPSVLVNLDNSTVTLQIK